MADILGIVTYDAIRASINVDVEEVTDEAIAALGLDEALLSDLNDWLPDSASISDIISEGAEHSGLTTTPARLKYLALQGYCRIFCAIDIMGTAENWRLTQLTDGVVASRRSDRVNLDKVVERLHATLNIYRDRLLGLLDQATATSSRPTFFSKATPNTDPVTNS